MTHQISINGRKIILVEVPEDSAHFIVDNSLQYLIFKIPNYKNWVSDDVLESPEKLRKFLENSPPDDSDWFTDGRKMPDGNSKLLGTITNEKIDFDVKNYCYSHNDLGKTWYQDYTKYPNGGWYLNPKDSFLSLLKSNNIDTTKKWVVILITD